jgi:hypothetical protein
MPISGTKRRRRPAALLTSLRVVRLEPPAVPVFLVPPSARDGFEIVFRRTRVKREGKAEEAAADRLLIADSASHLVQLVRSLQGPAGCRGLLCQALWPFPDRFPRSPSSSKALRQDRWWESPGEVMRLDLRFNAISGLSLGDERPGLFIGGASHPSMLRSTWAEHRRSAPAGGCGVRGVFGLVDGHEAEELGRSWGEECLHLLRELRTVPPPHPR